ncbi:hypothetical protein CRG98_043831 [Punica granatum]|nr:hypothetical protein CRG98_043831 [Punica granatum]
MADMLRRMQTLVRVQARARASRSYPTASSLSSTMSSLSQHPRNLSNANNRDSVDIDRAEFSSNWLDRWMEDSVLDSSNPDGPLRNKRHEDERSAKILEVDTWKPHFYSQTDHGSTQLSSNCAVDPDYMNKTFMPFDSPSKYSSRPPNPVPSLSSEEVASLRSLNFPKRKDKKFRSAENSPQVVSGLSRPGSRRGGPFTPARSECSWGFVSGYSGYPNYMANTESSLAKVRSQSAPRQRLELDRYGSSKRTALQGSWDGRSMANSERSYPINTDFRKRAYQVSNRLNRLGSANVR